MLKKYPVPGSVQVLSVPGSALVGPPGKYIRPQENGSKAEVRWAALTDLRGFGLLAVGRPRIGGVSAHHYATEDFAQARHAHELVRRDETILHVDHRQSGLGSQSCGPGPLPQYLITEREFSFATVLRPFSAEVMSAMRLSQVELEL